MRRETNRRYNHHHHRGEGEGNSNEYHQQHYDYSHHQSRDEYSQYQHHQPQNYQHYQQQEPYSHSQQQPPAPTTAPPAPPSKNEWPLNDDLEEDDDYARRLLDCCNTNSNTNNERKPHHYDYNDYLPPASPPQPNFPAMSGENMQTSSPRIVTSSSGSISVPSTIVATGSSASTPGSRASPPHRKRQRQSNDRQQDDEGDQQLFHLYDPSPSSAFSKIKIETPPAATTTPPRSSSTEHKKKMPIATLTPTSLQPPSAIRTDYNSTSRRRRPLNTHVSSEPRHYPSASSAAESSNKSYFNVPPPASNFAFTLSYSSSFDKSDTDEGTTARLKNDEPWSYRDEHNQYESHHSRHHHHHRPPPQQPQKRRQFENEIQYQQSLLPSRDDQPHHQEKRYREMKRQHSHHLHTQRTKYHGYHHSQQDTTTASESSKRPYKIEIGARHPTIVPPPQLPSMMPQCSSSSDYHRRHQGEQHKGSRSRSRENSHLKMSPVQQPVGPIQPSDHYHPQERHLYYRRDQQHYETPRPREDSRYHPPSSREMYRDYAKENKGYPITPSSSQVSSSSSTSKKKPSSSTTTKPKQRSKNTSSSTPSSSTTTKNTPSSKSSSSSHTPNVATSTWAQRLIELQSYKEQHGDCLVPQKYPPNLQLGVWVNKQRMEYKLLQDGKKSSMNRERIAKLEAVGFVWAKRKGQPTWDEKYSQLVEYKRAHGDCLVPTKYDVNPALGRWVSTQRAQYRIMMEQQQQMESSGDFDGSSDASGSSGKKTTMTMERVRKLEALGFVWRLQF